MKVDPGRLAATQSFASESLAGSPLPPPAATDQDTCPLRNLLGQSPAPAGAGPPPPALPLDTGPRYRRLHLHAAGGIGQVWLARDAALGRPVALKELKPQTGSHPALCARFLEEARITGQLEHPGIVPVYDLVTTAEGQAFYTMRFIQGRTLSQAIHDYHQKRERRQAGPLELRALLGAFTSVCQTVAYAHARGVIHRDLKGANVILGDFGEVMVLDWGLAKVLGRPEADGPPPVILEGEARPHETSPGQLMGTLAYMAPEQAAGRPDLIDRRTDVYALGAILYEVLTGQPPLLSPVDQATLSQDQEQQRENVLRRIQEQQPCRPRRLCPAAPRGLEAICLRALAKQPEERYPSAEELARDVQRWLADEPVAAHREPWPARLARWGRRHRRVVAGAAALLLAAVFFLTLLSVLLGRAQARTEAEKRDKEAALALAEKHYRTALDAVDRYCTDVSEDPQLRRRPDLRPLRSKLLSTARDFYRQFLRDRAGDPALQSRTAETIGRLARLTSEMESPARGVKLLEEARTTFTRLAGERPGNAAYRYNLAAVHNNLALLYRQTNQPARARASLRRALALKQGLARRHPDRRLYQASLAATYGNLGNFYNVAGETERSERMHRQALAICRRLAGDRDADAGDRRALAESQNNLAHLFHATRRTEQAVAEYRESLKVLRGLVRDFPRDPGHARQLATVQSNLGNCYRTLKQTGQAATAQREAVRILRKLVRDFPRVPDYQGDLAWVLNARGVLYQETGKPERARADYVEALAILGRLHHDFPEDRDFALELGRCAVNLADTLRKLGQVNAALARLDRAIRAVENAFGKVPTDTRARVVLFNTYFARAGVNQRRGRSADYAGDMGRAIRLDTGSRRARLEVMQATVLALMNDHRRAHEVARVLAERPSAPAATLFALSRAYYVCILAAGSDSLLSPEERERQLAEYSDAAVRLLQRCHAGGYFKEPARRQALEAFQSVAALRAHPHFQELMRQVVEAR
jgi:serine/threonine-protein kinase